MCCWRTGRQGSSRGGLAFRDGFDLELTLARPDHSVNVLDSEGKKRQVILPECELGLDQRRRRKLVLNLLNADGQVPLQSVL